MAHHKHGTRPSRGFTLVELMIVVAIIGVLAALAIYGARRYLTAAKASEAKHTVGSISRSAHSAFQREFAPTESLAEGAESVEASHQLCDSAPAVPVAVPKARKYQPSTADGEDFDTGDATTGWGCLRFGMSQPIYYQYHYTKGSSPVAPSSTSSCSGSCYEAGAIGDLDGDGIFARFARTGHVNTATGELKASTQVYVDAEAE